MAILKDLLGKGLYYAEHDATDSETWKEKMVSDCGKEKTPHLNYIMRFSFKMAYKNAGANFLLKWNLCRELKKLKKMNKNTRQIT
jgi:hypothetical protein